MAQRVSTIAQDTSTTPNTEQDLPNIVRFWILRLLVDLKADQHFVKRHGFRDEDIASQIGLNEFVNDDQDGEIEPGKVRKFLRKLYQEAQRDPAARTRMLAGIAAIEWAQQS